MKPVYCPTCMQIGHKCKEQPPRSQPPRRQPYQTNAQWKPMQNKQPPQRALSIHNAAAPVPQKPTPDANMVDTGEHQQRIGTKNKGKSIERPQNHVDLPSTSDQEAQWQTPKGNSPRRTNTVSMTRQDGVECTNGFALLNSGIESTGEAQTIPCQSHGM